MADAFQDLPADVIERVVFAACCASIGSAASLSRLSKAWAALVASDVLWRQLATEHFPSLRHLKSAANLPVGFDFRRFYIRNLLMQRETVDEWDVARQSGIYDWYASMRTVDGNQHEVYPGLRIRPVPPPSGRSLADLMLIVEIRFAGEICGAWSGRLAADPEKSEQALRPAHDHQHCEINTDPAAADVSWELPVFEGHPWPWFFREEGADETYIDWGALRLRIVVFSLATFRSYTVMNNQLVDGSHLNFVSRDFAEVDYGYVADSKQYEPGVQHDSPLKDGCQLESQLDLLVRTYSSTPLDRVDLPEGFQLLYTLRAEIVNSHRRTPGEVHPTASSRPQLRLRYQAERENMANWQVSRLESTQADLAGLLFDLVDGRPEEDDLLAWQNERFKKIKYVPHSEPFLGLDTKGTVVMHRV